jgi:3',5'-cyclic-AMP phosphodiesterase
VKKVCWTTDIHLNFVERDRIESFCQSIIEQKPDLVLIGGDIAEAPNVLLHLRILEDLLGCPMFFVLGNHDFYRGSIQGVHRDIKILVKHTANLHWLPDAGVVPLTGRTCLIGHGGWADGRLGDYDRSEVMLNDYVLIKELAALEFQERFRRLNRLGDDAAAYFDQVLPRALQKFPHVIVLTHVPPFKEACWHEGHISDDNYLPHFACRAIGEIFTEMMRLHPECEMTVLCGHTHSPGEVHILPNLHVKTGGATYGNPQVQQILHIQ